VKARIEPLVRGICPICSKEIMNKKQTAYINDGQEFVMYFTDGTKANFAICRECLKTLTKEQAQEILKRQIVSWGQEIQAQLNWFMQDAVHLKIDKWILG